MKSLRSLKPHLLRYKWHFIWGIVFVFLANLFGSKVPVYVGDAVNVAERGRAGVGDLAWLAGFVVTLAGLAACFRFLMRRVMIDASRDLEYDLRNEFFAKLQALDPAFYDGRNTGDLMARGTNDMDAVRMFIGPSVMYMANTAFSMPLILAQMVLLDWRLTAMSLVPMLALPPLVMRMGRLMHQYSRAQQDEFGNLTTYAQENLAGVTVVKAYRQEENQTRGFGVLNDSYRDRSLRLALVQSWFFPGIRTLVGFGFLVLLVLGGRDVMAGRLETGTLISMVLLFGMVVWPMIAIGWVINLAQRGIASLERINEVLSSEPLVQPPTSPKPFPEEPSITLRDLTFQYPGTASPQLSSIDIDIPAGATVGIIGPVGCGKTTLVNLVARLYPVERGHLLLGGTDINDIDLRELRRNIAFVFQETFLFSDTIEWNIRFGMAGGGTDDHERHARMARLHAEVERLPERYATELGERGINLSGGQRQRLAIARALARDPRILILDDALSAVDTHTEEEILGELRGQFRGRTVFLISHRVSTLALADVVLVIEEGRITQRGTHEELIAVPGLYQRLHQRQLLERAVEEFEDEAVTAGGSP